jgi:uncharacterized damage-inducible protein DinB
MTPDQAEFLRDELVALVEREAPATRRMIEAIPERKLSYRPHAKAMSMHELAWHIVQAEHLTLVVAAQGTWDDIDLDEPMPRTVAELLAYHDRRLPEGLAKVRAMNGATLLEGCNLFGGADTRVRRLFYVPTHLIHHRGQLSAYLRAAGAVVPGVYGWSADEREAAGGAA